MNVARPIKPKEFEKFRQELYHFKDGTESGVKATVQLDEDPTMKPRNITVKLSQVQAAKDRVLVIFNRAILAENYWRTVFRRVEAVYDSEEKKAYLHEDVRTAKNAELRKGAAASLAEKASFEKLFKKKEVKEGEEDETFSDKLAFVSRNLQDAVTFAAEVKNIYENLHSTDQNLARQLRSVMVNTKVYGDPSEEEPSEKTVGVR